MGLDDKVDAQLDQAKGEFKEKVGEVTNDRETELEGKADQVKGDLKEGLENVKEAAKDATD